MAITRPTFSSGTWFTEHSAAIDQVMEQLIDVHKQACPTLRIMLANKQNVDIGPDGKIGSNFIHDMYNVAVAAFNQRFAAPDIDLASRMEWSTEQMYVSAGTNDFEMKRYRNDYSRIDLIDEKVQAMHAGLTWVFNYLLFSDWNETITGQEIDLETELTNAPVKPTVKFENLTAHGKRMYSIPMIIRKHVTGHTVGNVSSANDFWAPTVTDASDATVTRNTTTADEQCDVVTAITAGSGNFDLDALRTHLNTIQRGYGYELYGACPANLYDVLEDLLLAERRFDADRDTPLRDIGVDASFVYRSRNVTFYVEPMMTDLWGSTIFFYDPSVMHLVLDNDFDPSEATGIYPWERIPGTNQSATAVFGDVNLVCWDRRAVSAMHGYAP